MGKIFMNQNMTIEKENKILKKGYKQTEIGFIPEDWFLTNLGNLATFQGGFAFSSKNFKDYGYYQIVKMTNLYSGILDLDRSCSFINNINESSKSYLLNKNDLLITLTGTIGKTDFGYTWLIKDEKNLLLNQRVARIIANRKVDPVLLSYETKLNRFKKQFFELSKGGTGNQTNVSTIDFEKIIIPLPPTIEEQKAISQALSDVDSLINSIEKTISKKCDIKTATMQQLLTGKKRLVGFGEGKGYKQTEIGFIPEDWSFEFLGNLGQFKNGINKGNEDFGHGSPFVNLMDVFGVSSISESNHLGLINSNILEKNVYDLREGDVLFIRSSVKPSGVGLTSVITKNLKDTVYSGFLIRYRDNGKINNEFKKYCFSEENFRKRIISNSTISANTNINQESLKKIILPLPTKIEEQKAIAQILTDMDDEIKTLENKLEKTKLIKQGMMQELLTGKTRLL